jgi:hypothetical protein
MARMVLLALAAAGVLFVSGAAQAKSPATGIHVCGASGCVDVAPSDAEVMWSEGFVSDRPVAAAPFYTVRWHFGSEPDQSAYFIPSERTFRWIEPRGWRIVSPHAVGILKNAIGRLAPYDLPALTRVTVGGREVRAPATYTSLLRGRLWWRWPAGRWLTVKLESTAPSPWTNGEMIVRLNRRGPYVVMDGWVFKIPQAVAVRARHGLSLGG